MGGSCRGPEGAAWDDEDVAFTTLLAIQALLVGVAVGLLRPGADVLAGRVLGAEVSRGDLRLAGGICVAAAVGVVVGVGLLNGAGPVVPLLVVSALAAAGAVLLARRLDRPEVQAAMMRWLERTLLRTRELGRAGGEQATRLGRDVTSRARRAGEELAARRR